jgi:hypothetical protein
MPQIPPIPQADTPGRVDLELAHSELVGHICCSARYIDFPYEQLTEHTLRQ